MSHAPTRVASKGADRLRLGSGFQQYERGKSSKREPREARRCRYWGAAQDILGPVSPATHVALYAINVETRSSDTYAGGQS